MYFAPLLGVGGPAEDNADLVPITKTQYMDRTYVQQQHKTHVHQLGLDLWRDCVVRNKAISERLRQILLELVRQERTGELIDKQLMRHTTKVARIAIPCPAMLQTTQTRW